MHEKKIEFVCSDINLKFPTAGALDENHLKETRKMAISSCKEQKGDLD